MPDDDDEQVVPAGDLEIFADLGMSSMELAAICSDLELYPDEMLGQIAARIGFGPQFDRAVDDDLSLSRRRRQGVLLHRCPRPHGPRVDGARPRPRQRVDDLKELAVRPARPRPRPTSRSCCSSSARTPGGRVVRVDGEEDPRVFVSDLAGRGRSSYAALLDVDSDQRGRRGARAPAAATSTCWPTSGRRPEALQEMCDDQPLPMDALAAVAEAAGFGEILDSLR